MNKKKGSHLAFGLVMVLVGFALGLFISNPPLANAGDRLHYKVALFDDFHSAEAYEAFLNDFAAQGWEFDHVIQMTDKVVFKRSQ